LKKTGIFNAQIASAVSSMGHKDKLAIVDMGFPIPVVANKCDLVVEKGSPGFFDVVNMVLKELMVEKIIVADEMRDENVRYYHQLKEQFQEKEVELISHERLKEIANDSRIIIRTGEDTPYSNVILVSGVIF